MSVPVDASRPPPRPAPTLAELAAACLAVSRAPEARKPLRIFGEQVLARPIEDAIAESGLPAPSLAEPVFGTAEHLCGRIERGEKADLYLSEDLVRPRRLVTADLAKHVIPFARQGHCAAILGMAVVTDRPEALLFATFLLSEEGQAVLARHGFRPVASDL
ncbi:substrate-binding domain-containing protein [Enterovirga rhinocerotis]|uniref:Extracellular solute-binding protein n=1 Tax=Enterovirga rhinocerotis TaxID=1339210 RepID=A0A4R7CC34_9HYPH|nr:hypothetical protein [Enterovirga rhinocerotis]TDR95015.1 hypothetical protein EV668_2307 [Enterovirga rhinocerotis]